MSTDVETLQARLRDQALTMGADYFGVADLTSAKSFVAALGGDFAAEFPTGISIGFALADGVVDQLYQHENANVGRVYRHHIYTAIFDLLGRTATMLAFQIERQGYRAMPVPPSSFYDAKRLAPVMSHKLTAHLAGLGWIGKNCLMTTKVHGPRVRWVTVLTDAPLASTGTASTVDHCKSCNLCVDLCPVQAFSGVPFDPADPVQVRFDTWKCKQYLDDREHNFGVQFCGVCVHVCPHGWSQKRKKHAARTTPALLRQRLGGIVPATA